ncbi:MAG: bifunctional folylpolyglutamate synthase/dihydrofolate synthase, partial [Clostridia bacterium]|nr:bifunctional folylpolyglutamate synthase/dihydrofolate synthase [Clostridia bacterium]
SEAIDYIRNIERGGSDYGIERMCELVNLLGSPDESLKFVHVAGTNGKGSVCAYLTSVLKESGYKVGTYNSPSVFRYNERWSIDGEALSDELVAKYLTEVREVIERENARRKFCPTAFEIETAVAMLAFLEQGCDIAVLETGLGGRWDATNAIRKKELAVITPIGLDHCALLGDTLQEIASEKAAIIKDVAVTCEQSDEIMHEICNPYHIVDGQRVEVSADVKLCQSARLIAHDINGQKFEYGGGIYEISMLGEHQLQNASIAICAVEELRKKRWNIPENALAQGLKNTVWHARLEVVKNAQTKFNIAVPEGKTLVFDGAHNPHGATALAKAIKDYFCGMRVHLIVGMLADKDVDGVVSLLAPLATRATTVTPPSPRALDKDKLKEKFVPYVGDSCDTIRGAVQNALDDDCEVVVLCGSLTLFGAL